MATPLVSAMEALLTSGRLLDAILCLIVIEGIVIIVVHGNNSARPSPRMLIPNLISGAALMLGIRLALAQAEWYWLTLCLSVSLLAHLSDLVLRYQPQGRSFDQN
ncbi:MAG: hypothetical protein P8Q31_04315 [Luminiphilus sp.]|nr:hypothetical protein [Luminiphilus sp.]MDG1460726.1 hypothetical protein [Luminiphilus sp.]